MTLALLVRPMDPSEVSMVLSAWKKDLRLENHRLGKGDFYRLVNHVLDRIVFPFCEVHMGCHPDEPLVPICWAVLRRGEVLHLYARRKIREKDPELGAELQRTLLSQIGTTTLATFDPFKELESHQP